MKKQIGVESLKKVLDFSEKLKEASVAGFRFNSATDVCKACKTSPVILVAMRKLGYLSDGTGKNSTVLYEKLEPFDARKIINKRNEIQEEYSKPKDVLVKTCTTSSFKDMSDEELVKELKRRGFEGQISKMVKL